MNAVVKQLGEPREARGSHEQDPYSSNMSWEVDRLKAAKKSESRAWMVAVAALCVAVIAIIAVALQGPLRRVETVAIVVDKSTGASYVETRLSEQTIPANEALDMNNAATFVRAREGYYWPFLQKQYDTVSRMSTPDVFKTYAKQFTGDDDLSKKFGAVGEYRVDIINVRGRPGGRLGNQGELVVTFDKTRKDPQTSVVSTLRYVSTLRFEYRPKVLQKEVDRIENPFGFIVTAYRADVELVDK